MIRRSTWIMLALFVVLLGGYIYLQKRPAAPASTSPTLTPAPSLLNTTADNIMAIKLVDPNGTILTIRDQNNQWIVKQPTDGQITQGNVQEILSQVTSLSVLSSLPAAPPPNATGLMQPMYTITFSLKDGSVRVLVIGKLTPIQNGYYAQVDQGVTLVVGQAGIDRVAELLKSARATPTSPPPAVTPTTTAPPTAVTPTLSPTTPDQTLTPTTAP